MYLPLDVYSRPNKKGVKVKLLKSLYGLKQAGELWNKLLNEKLLAMGLTRSINDQCIYIKRDTESGDVTIVIVYVDDIIFTGNNPKIIDDMINSLSTEFKKITRLGELTRYIGVDIERDLEENTISLSQDPYLQSYLDTEVDPGTNEKPIPLNPVLDYRAKPNEADETNEPIHQQIGKLRYLADRTVPQLQFATSILARNMTKPTANVKAGLKRTGRYLKGIKGNKVKYGGPDKLIKLFGFSDASYVKGADSKSQLAYCFFLNLTSGAICVRTKKDTIVSLSSTEAEINAIVKAARQAKWLREFLAELGFPQNEPTVIFTDNKSAKDLAEIYNLGNNSEHMVQQINYLHQEIMNGNIELKYIDTDNQVADVLTKALSRIPFERHTHFLTKGFDGNPITPKQKTRPIKSKRAKPTFKSKH